ncbi:MAG: hypothetical protein IJR94_04670 [Synergistaceae bacterium]|nr:hypothetical protein [Synergistaceae bacterium]
MKPNEIKSSETENKNNQQEIMISELLSAISETEYPQYILDAIEKVIEWINEEINRPENRQDSDFFSEFFGQDFDFEDDTGGIEELYRKLNSIEEFADIMPSSRKRGDKSDTIIINLASPDYDSGLRRAIDYAAVFNRANCKRVWIISDSFVLGDILKFVPHVDALGEQGITLRFILVTPWGWVEMPLSGNAASKEQCLWHSNNK